jgi:hypothetical protein
MVIRLSRGAASVSELAAPLDIVDGERQPLPC